MQVALGHLCHPFSVFVKAAGAQRGLHLRLQEQSVRVCVCGVVWCGVVWCGVVLLYFSMPVDSCRCLQRTQHLG